MGCGYPRRGMFRRIYGGTVHMVTTRRLGGVVGVVESLVNLRALGCGFEYLQSDT